MAEDENKTKNRHISIIVRAAVAIVACAVIANNLDIKHFWTIFSTISPITACGVIVIFMISQAIIAIRWWIFMRALDVHVGCWMSIKLTFLGLYFNNFLPGSVGGDLVRAWYVAHNTDKRMASVVSVMADRIIALVSTLVLAIGAFVLAGKKEMLSTQAEPASFDEVTRYKTAILIAFLVLFILGVLVVLQPACRRKLKPIIDRVLRHIHNAFRHSIEAAMVIIKKPLIVPEMMLITFFLQSMVIFSMWVLGREMNITAELSVFFVVFPLTWVAGAIPISVAGIGVVEGGIIYLLMHFGGASGEAAAALALFQRVVWIIASLPGLGVYLAGKHLPKDFHDRFSIDGKG